MVNVESMQNYEFIQEAEQFRCVECDRPVPEDYENELCEVCLSYCHACLDDREDDNDELYCPDCAGEMEA